MMIDVNGTTSDKSVLRFVRNGFAIFFPYIVCAVTFVIVLCKYECLKSKQIIQCIVILLLLIARLLWIFKVNSDLKEDITEIILCYCLMTDIVLSAHTDEAIVLTKLNRAVIWVAPSVLAVLSAIIWFTDSNSKAINKELGIALEVCKLVVTAVIIVIQLIICFKPPKLQVIFQKEIRFCVKSEDDVDLEDSINSNYREDVGICKKIMRFCVIRKNVIGDSLATRDDITGTPKSINSVYSRGDNKQDRKKSESIADDNDVPLTVVQYLDPEPVGPSDGIFMALRDKLKTHTIHLIKIGEMDFETEAYGTGPVMVICHFRGRLSESILTTLKEIKSCDYQRVVLIVMHCTAKHCLPVISSKEKVTSNLNLNALVEIVDMGCLPFSDTSADIYDCPFNKKALETIDNLFLRQ